MLLAAALSLCLYVSVGIQEFSVLSSCVSSMATLHNRPKLKLNIKKPEPVIGFEVRGGINALMAQIANAGE